MDEYELKNFRSITEECYFCHGSEDVQLCRVELIPGSAGVIRQICATCRDGGFLADEYENSGYDPKDDYRKKN